MGLIREERGRYELGSTRPVPPRTNERNRRLIIPITLSPAVVMHHHRGTSESGYATYYNRGDSNPHLADGTYYGDHGPLFCAAPSSIPLGSVICIHSSVTGRTIRVVVRDRGPGHLDLSRGAFERLGGRGGRLAIEAHVERLGSNRSETHSRKQQRRQRK
jgi:rare lipoprotein A (peptidoglycan hydrolase)